MMRLRLAMIACFLSVSCAGPVWADTSSTNYAIVEDRFTGGGGDATSTNYALEGTSFDFFGGDLSSANYGIETKAGISNGFGIAVIGSVSPANFSKFYSDGNASYTITAVSEDSDTLQYGALQDSSTAVSAQASSAVTWALSGADLGRHTITLQAIDPDGTTITKRDAYVARRPTK